MVHGDGSTGFIERVILTSPFSKVVQITTAHVGLVLSFEELQHPLAFRNLVCLHFIVFNLDSRQQSACSMFGTTLQYVAHERECLHPAIVPSPDAPSHSNQVHFMVIIFIHLQTFLMLCINHDVPAATGFFTGLHEPRFDGMIRE